MTVSFSIPKPSVRRRLAIAVVVGIVAGIGAFFFLARPGAGGDYFFVWSAARTLLSGGNPYRVIAVGPENPGHDVLLYDYLGQGQSSAPDEPAGLMPPVSGPDSAMPSVPRR